MIAILISFLIILISIIAFIFAADMRSRFIWLTNFWWSGLIIINRTRLSELQLEWSLQEQILASLLLFIPSVLCNIFIFIAPKKSNSYINKRLYDFKKNNKYYNQKAASICQKILLVCFSILVLDIFLNGVPLLSADLGERILNEVRLTGRIPLIYNIAHQGILMGLIGLAVVQASLGKEIKTYVLVFFLAYLIHSILMVSRGTISYAVIAIFLSYAFASPSKFTTKIRKLAIPAGLFIFAFAAAGVFRQTDASSEVSFSIIEYGLFPNWLPNTIAWFYGYVVISLDNLIMCIRDFYLVEEFRVKTIQNFSPAFYNMFFLDSTDLSDIHMTQTMPYVGRFNLVTAFGYIGYDSGWLGVYIFSMFLYLLIPALFSSGFSHMSVVKQIMFVYLSMIFMFITVASFVLSSRAIGFILSLIIFYLMMKAREKGYHITQQTFKKVD